MKFIHAADLHLDSPMLGLERYEGAPVDRLRGATRRALEKLVALAIDERVDFVLIAGDVYDGDWRDFNTGLYFVSQMARLRDAEIPVFVIRGNHDAASQITRTLPLPDNVRFLGHEAAESVRLEDLGVVVHGQSYARREVTTDLSAGYPAAERACFNIGLLHTAAGGREGHENYAPCTLAGLAAKGYDYWALGHVHEREVLSKDPWIVFAGNTQGRHARETGEKGCTLVTVEAGRVRAVEHRSLDVVRWRRLEVDATAAENMDDIHGRFERAIEAALDPDGRLVVARVAIGGMCAAHAAAVREGESFVRHCQSLAIGQWRDRVWLEKVRLETRPAIDVEELMARGGAEGEMVRHLRELYADDAAFEPIAAELRAMVAKLPAEVRRSQESPIDDLPSLRGMLGEVEALLLARMSSEEAAE